MPAAMQPVAEIRTLAAGDVDAVAAAFESWPKPRRLFERYLAEQLGGRRVVLVAWCETRVCGYAAVVWHPDHPPFRENGIPEIQDLNVLPAFRRRGVGSRLLDAAEELASSRSPVVGIGVGVYADYGAAQRLYVRAATSPTDAAPATAAAPSSAARRSSRTTTSCCASPGGCVTDSRSSAVILRSSVPP